MLLYDYLGESQKRNRRKWPGKRRAFLPNRKREKRNKLRENNEHIKRKLKRECHPIQKKNQSVLMI